MVQVERGCGGGVASKRARHDGHAAPLDTHLGSNNNGATKTTTTTTTTQQPPAPSSNSNSNGVKLRRSLGVWNGIAIIIGVIVGSGIFISPKGVLMHAGSPGAALLVWCLCGLLALLGALCFAELGTSIAASGGEYTYIRLAYGPLASYLYIWVLVLVIMPCGNAISALTFANYCLQPLYAEPHGPPEQAIRLLAVAILMLLIYINCRTVSGSINLQSSFTLAKVLALGLIIVYGLWYVFSGQPIRALDVDEQAAAASGQSAGGVGVEPLATGGGVLEVARNATAGQQQQQHGWWYGTQTSLPQLARAFYSGFFTYSGWSTLNAVTEEIQEPTKNMPRAIVTSISFVTLIYILANCAYFAVLTKQEILNTDAIAVLFGDHVGLLARLSLRWLMPFVVALSTVGGLNASIFAASRVYFAAAREGQLLGALAMINLNQLTPVPSLLFLGATSMLYLCTTKISSLIEYMTFVGASFAALGVSTMLALRARMPHLKRPLRVPALVPIVYLLFTAAMLVLPLLSSPVEALIGLAITLTGLPAYYLTARWHEKPVNYQRAIDKFNRITQLLTMSVSPARDLELKL